MKANDYSVYTSMLLLAVLLFGIALSGGCSDKTLTSGKEFHSLKKSWTEIEQTLGGSKNEVRLSQINTKINEFEAKIISFELRNPDFANNQQYQDDLYRYRYQLVPLYRKEIATVKKTLATE